MVGIQKYFKLHSFSECYKALDSQPVRLFHQTESSLYHSSSLLYMLAHTSRILWSTDQPSYWLSIHFSAFPTLPPPFSKAFDPSRHLLQQDITFTFPGASVTVKWAKNLQAPECSHSVRIPEVRDHVLCPVTNIRALSNSRAGCPDTPLFLTSDGSFLIQAMLRRPFTSVLTYLHIPLSGLGFHTFRRSGATIAFDAKVPLQTLQMHSLWHSDAIWSYISSNTSLSLQVPLTFQKLFNSLP